YAIFRIIKEKKINLLFLVLAITALFISWTVVKRITFLYLFLPVIPLLALLVGGFLAELWSKKQKYLKTIAVVLLVLIAGFFIYFYPLMIGTPVSYKTYYNHMWLKSWY
ncbi:MAG: hypothetical protein M1338_00900, partial [Patescibacteria group bacterium]|nr:hypothetical protein [Patescibacteria group bacterium]